MHIHLNSVIDICSNIQELTMWPRDFMHTHFIQLPHHMKQSPSHSGEEADVGCRITWNNCIVRVPGRQMQAGCRIIGNRCSVILEKGQIQKQLSSHGGDKVYWYKLLDEVEHSAGPIRCYQAVMPMAWQSATSPRTGRGAGSKHMARARGDQWEWWATLSSRPMGCPEFPLQANGASVAKIPPLVETWHWSPSGCLSARPSGQPWAVSGLWPTCSCACLEAYCIASWWLSKISLSNWSRNACLSSPGLLLPASIDRTHLSP